MLAAQIQLRERQIIKCAANQHPSFSLSRTNPSAVRAYIFDRELDGVLVERGVGLAGSGFRSGKLKRGVGGGLGGMSLRPY
jgi:hypothetical protein